MAIWQFDFHLIPASSAKERAREMSLVIGAKEFEDVDWWEGLDLLHDIERHLSLLLPRGPSWHSELLAWGEDEGDRFDVWQDGHRIRDVFGRIDVRELSPIALNRVIEIARRHDLVIVTEAECILQPSAEHLLAAIRRSPSFAFVSDPEGFLRRLAERE